NLSSADASFWGEDAGDESGISVSSAGDVNGDGYDDLLIGAYNDEDGGSMAGQTYLILGKATGWAMDTDLSSADASFWGEDAEGLSGYSVSSAGDVNGDGYDDLLIGAPSDDDGGSNAGQTYLILGGGTPVPSIQIIEPDGADDIANTSYTITWTDEDPDDDATIYLYYDTDNTGEDGTLIIDSISEDDETDAYEWDTSSIPEGDYYVYAVIDDGVNPSAVNYSTGPVTIDHSCNPPATGDWTITESCTFDDIATAPADVIVDPNVVLTISDSAVLNIDFVNNKLLVQENGGVLIMPGGKISQ
ncbi:MAG: hypothetical protein GY861_28210, partial [bacterium]|nr:hypothetical protein [bacterium]